MIHYYLLLFPVLVVLIKEIHCDSSIDVYSSHSLNLHLPYTILPTDPSQPQLNTVLVTLR